MKTIHIFVDKTAFLLSSFKTSGRFFQNFVAFSEKLDFNSRFLKFWHFLIESGFELKQFFSKSSKMYSCLPLRFWTVYFVILKGNSAQCKNIRGNIELSRLYMSGSKRRCCPPTESMYVSKYVVGQFTVHCGGHQCSFIQLQMAG